MSINILPASNDVWGRLGSSLGKGLSEHLPKEIKNQRLSAGLENIKNNPNLSPLERVQHLYRNGATSEDISHLTPLIQQAQINQEAQRNFGSGKSSTSQGVAKPGMPEEKSMEIRSGKSNLGNMQQQDGMSLSQRRNTPGFLTPPDPQQQEIEASELQRQQPSRFLNFQDAVEEIKKRDINKLVQDQAIEEKSQKVEAEHKKRTSSILQKEGELEKYKDVSGKFVQDSIDRAKERALDEGIHPDVAADKEAKRVLKVSNAGNSLEKLRAGAAYFMTPSKRNQQFTALREVYKEEDADQEFRNRLIGRVGLTPGIADVLTFPQEGKSKEVLSELKPSRPLGSSLSNKEYEKIKRSVGNDDSLNSIAYELRAKGYNWNDFLARAVKDQDFRKNILNQRQLEEFNDVPDFSRMSFKDILWLHSLNKHV